MGDDSPICSRARDVLDDGGDPDGSEAHALDVVELVDDALPGATTVVSEVARCRGAAIGAGVDDGSERLVYSYHGNRVGVLRCWLFQGCLQSLGCQISFLSARDCLFGLSTFIVCIDFLGAPNVAKVGWKSYVTSSEVVVFGCDGEKIW